MNLGDTTRRRMPIEVKLPLFTVLAAVTIAFVLALTGGEAIARSSGIIDRSGNPSAGDGLNCTTCHQGGAEATVAVSAPGAVLAGETVQITVTISGGPGMIGGFNASFDDLAGVIESVGDETQVLSRQITHTSPQSFVDGEATFTFDWTAPTEAGATTLYAAAVSANQNGSPTGDAVGTATASILVQAGELLGDVNCDGESNIVDALFIAGYDAGVRVDGISCPLDEPAVELILTGADFNLSGMVDIVDALLIARCDAGLVGPGCTGADDPAAN